MTIVMWGAGAALVLGLVLAVRGWRGRREGDHPVCGRCGFDLFGLPEGAKACSECGADLSAPRAVHIGHRRRRGGMLAGGAALLLLAISGLALVGATRWSDLDVNQYKPAWLLMREAGSDDAALRDAAMVELSDRLRAGKLRPDHVAAMLDKLLAWQADEKRTWVQFWGAFLENARLAGLVPDDKWAQYALNSTKPTMDVRPVLRRGDPLPYWLGSTPGRVAKSQRVRLNGQWFIKGYSIAGRRIKNPRQSGSGVSIDIWGGRSSGSQLEIKAKDLEGVPDGLTTIDVVIEQTFYEQGGEWPGKHLGTRTTTITAPVELVPADAETVKIVRDPSLREAVEGSLVIDSWHMSRSGRTRAAFIEDDETLTFEMSASNPPVGLAYDVFVKTPQREWKVGTATFPKGQRGGWGIHEDVKDLSGFDPQKAAQVDLILRPSVKVALNTIDILEMWDGEVTIHDVPVHRVMSSKKAAATRNAK